MIKSDSHGTDQHGRRNRGDVINEKLAANDGEDNFWSGATGSEKRPERGGGKQQTGVEQGGADI